MSNPELIGQHSERINLLGGILRRIGFFNMNSFEGRLVFQKLIYFLQVFKLYLGYRFSWYIYGPYSTDLTRDGFELMKLFKDVKEVKFAEKDFEKSFDEFSNFIGDKKTDAVWLEVLASIHFLKRLYPNMKKEEIINNLLKKQEYFKKEICEDAWNYLKRFKLLDE